MTNQTKAKPTKGPLNVSQVIQIENEAKEIYHETGLSPRELKEQRDQLFKAARVALVNIPVCNHPLEGKALCYCGVRQRLEAAILRAKATELEGK